MTTRKEQQHDPYEPIRCGFHDELLALATRRLTIEIVYLDAQGKEFHVTDTIVDVFTQSKAEYLRLQSGDEIRLDKLIRVNGRQP